MLFQKVDRISNFKIKLLQVIVKHPFKIGKQLRATQNRLYFSNANKKNTVNNNMHIPIATYKVSPKTYLLFFELAKIAVLRMTH